MTHLNDILEICRDEISDPALTNWFMDRLSALGNKQSFMLSFGLVGRKIPARPLADAARQATSMDSLDQLCRLCLLLQLDTEKTHAFITELIESADMREQIAIYRSIPHLENKADFMLTVIDGIRTNMVDIFDAIALDNPYPALHFPEEAWNQMVLKAIFMERPIYRIQGLDQRKNQQLAMILSDFAHERWSAGRTVTPELWRMMPGFINKQIFEDLRHVITTDIPLSRQAAVKAIAEGSFQDGLNWLQSQGVAPTTLTWQEIGIKNKTLA